MRALADGESLILITFNGTTLLWMVKETGLLGNARSASFARVKTTNMLWWELHFCLSCSSNDSYGHQSNWTLRTQVLQSYRGVQSGWWRRRRRGHPSYSYIRCAYPIFFFKISTERQLWKWGIQIFELAPANKSLHVTAHLSNHKPDKPPEHDITNQPHQLLHQ